MELQPLHFCRNQVYLFDKMILYHSYCTSGSFFHSMWFCYPLNHGSGRFTGLFCTTQLSVRSSGCIGSTGSTMSAWLRTVFFYTDWQLCFWWKNIIWCCPPQLNPTFVVKHNTLFSKFATLKCSAILSSSGTVGYSLLVGSRVLSETFELGSVSAGLSPYMNLKPSLEKRQWLFSKVGFRLVFGLT